MNVKVFYTDSQLLLYSIDGKWLHGNREFLDHGGHPIDHNGFAMTGDPIDAVIRNEMRNGGICLDHGVAVQLKCGDGWHSMKYEPHITDAAETLIRDMLASRMKRDLSEYRLLSCDCLGVSGYPAVCEAC